METSTPIVDNFSSYEKRAIMIQLLALANVKAGNELISLKEIENERWFKLFEESMNTALQDLVDKKIITISICKGPNFDKYGQN